MRIPCCPVLLFIACLSAIIGMFLFLRPAQAIKFQIKFYEKINWRMEPISMPKEIRNTKVMGLLLFIIAIVTLFFFIKS